MLWLDISADHVHDLPGGINDARRSAPALSYLMRTRYRQLKLIRETVPANPEIVVPDLPIEAAVLNGVHTAESTTEDLLWLWEESRR